MWYEIVPSFAVIVTVLAIPGYSMYIMNKAALGNPYKRSMVHVWDRRMYLRDKRISGDPYRPAGLEAIPDK